MILRYINSIFTFTFTFTLMLCVGGATVEQYSPRADVWSQVASLPRRRLQFAVAVLGRCVYVVGGRDGLRTLDVVQMFDVTTHSWSTVCALNTQRHGLGQLTLFIVQHSQLPPLSSG